MLLHVFIFFLIYCLLSFFGFITSYPAAKFLNNFDASWYQKIVENGYSYVEGKYSNVAFFPLFPLIWKLSGLDMLGISVLNLLFLFTGLFFLHKTFEISRANMLLFLSVPSLVFCFLPYSEGLFFMCSSLLLYGLKNNFKLALLGIFLASLTRSASLIFIPLIVFSMLYNYRQEKSNKDLYVRTILLILSTISATLIAQYYIYLESGEFFALFKVQEVWNRKLSMPSLFFTTWDGGRMIWLDSLALLTGLISTFMVIVLIVKKLVRKTKMLPVYFLFSIAYLSLITIVTLFFAGLNSRGETTLISLNRYVFANPFFIVFLSYVFRHFKLSRQNIVTFIILSMTTYTLCNFFGDITVVNKFNLSRIPISNTKIYFYIVFIYSALYVAFANKKCMTQVWSGLYLVNIILFIYLYTSFVHGFWIG